MKTFYLLIFLMLSTQIVFGQIPNGNFEEWTTEYNYEKPTHWETNQDTLYDRISRDIDKIEGEYSLKLSTDSPSAWVDCNSRASLATSLDETITENQFISFYLKSIPVETQDVFFHFAAFYFKDGLKQGEEIFTAGQTYNEFTLIEFANIPTGVDSLQITIISGANNGADDGCYHYTTSWVDDLKINKRTTSTSQNIKQNGVNIYPNPSSGIFNIDQPTDEFKRYRILDILGKEIMSGTLENSKVRIERKGPYILQLFSQYNSDRNIVRKITVL